MTSALTPQQIVLELDKHIIGQNEAKRAVALALRNRWRRMQLNDDLKDEVMPKNILMIGPTGVGKTEIARRLAKLCQAPFIKVEATKFTEIGYVGRDVEQMIRDLVEVSLHMTKQRMKKEVTKKAAKLAEERILKVLVGDNSTPETKEKFRDLLTRGKLHDKEIEIDVIDAPSSNSSMIDIPGMPGSQMGMINLGDILGKSFEQTKTKSKKLTVEEALRVSQEEEADKLLDQEAITAEALDSVQNNGIVFIDEIDKVCTRNDQRGGEVSREGVQRDLLPLIEGTSVTTKHGTIQTDHILFITSGAFHVSKPSDLLPELQGRLPIRVELKALKKEDFVAILTQTQANLIEQSIALLGTENVTLKFDKEAIETIAELAEDMNTNVENIGARRLHTLVEKLIEEISFDASEKSGESLTISKTMVEEKIRPLVQHQDLSRFVL